MAGHDVILGRVSTDKLSSQVSVIVGGVEVSWSVVPYCYISNVRAVDKGTAEQCLAVE